MSFLRVPGLAGLASVVAATSLALIVTSTGCSSDPPSSTGSGFCGAAKAANQTCKEPADCDATLATGCAQLSKVLTDTLTTAARDCLESGVCGVASCLQRAQKSAKTTDAHTQLASDYCGTCAPDVEDCESKFYARGSKLPGALLVPYGESVVSAVDSECTSEAGCAAQFNSCATDVIARVLGDEVDGDVASCIQSGFSQEDGAVTPAGKPTVATCTPDNCQGCCRDDKCEEGTKADACGMNAGSCEICSSTAECVEGKCKEPCGPNNCKGCCEGDTCVDGSQDVACGERGAACTSCGASETCSNHQCVDGTCQANCINGCCSATGCQAGNIASACGSGGEACVDCGVGRTCESGACTLDRTSLWDVYVAFVIVPDFDKTGATWDPLNGAPDPYVKLYSSEGTSVHSAQTTTMTDTTVPYWAETPLKGIKASELLANFSFEVWDSDTTFDDYIGGCTVKLQPAIFDGSLQDDTCPATASSSEVTLYYRINPH